jgi:CCR4-NOT transcription complex subunit 1
VHQRYQDRPNGTPPEVAAALDLMRVLGDRAPHGLALYIHKSGADFTRDEESCVLFLQNRPTGIQPSEEQVSLALTYTTISQTPQHNPLTLVAALRHIVPDSFRWQDVIGYFDQRGAHISKTQFLRLYKALQPVAEEQPTAMDIQTLWGGDWQNPETQLSFVAAFLSLSPDQLDATKIPNLQPTFTLEEYADSSQAIQARAAEAVRHPLVSNVAVSAILQVALHSHHASQTPEAKWLFEAAVIPNLDIFVVSAFGVPKPWTNVAVESLNSLIDQFVNKAGQHSDFVLDSLWRRDKALVVQRLINVHNDSPSQLPLIFQHATQHKWLNELVYLPSGFGLDLAAYAHAQGLLDLPEWAKNCLDRTPELPRLLLQFLHVKTNLEVQSQRPEASLLPAASKTTPLHLRTISAFLGVVEQCLQNGAPMAELILAQRQCIAAYPRLINYGEGFDDIIDANGKDGHALPQAANARMEEHFKKMYSNEVEVKSVVEALGHYKTSRQPFDQDVFADMIHSLFEEYSHLSDYPLEALATTAVLFGGIIRHKLINNLPLKVGLGMILEAVRDHVSDQPMYKFGLQALIQLFPRLREWPDYCVSLLQIPGLRGTEAWKKAEDVVRENEEAGTALRGGRTGDVHQDAMTNGSMADAPDQHPPPFASVNPDLPSTLRAFQDPSPEVQGRIQFCLNNLDDKNHAEIFAELQHLVLEEYQRWFARDLVEARAKRMPNLQPAILDLILRFKDKSLWNEVLRETYVSISNMLNSDATMQNPTERTWLKHLGVWLGSMTLARDQPIKQKNIAFKQLLAEAHSTKRLIMVIPFVRQVLLGGVDSKIFKPPNPWLMDIIRLLVSLYRTGDLKLNQKFDVELLCGKFGLDYKSIEPSEEIQNRPPIEEIAELGTEPLDTFENLSLNGIGPAVTSGLSPHSIAPSIPDVGPNLTIPSVSEMVVSSSRLHEIVRNALTRALQDIIQPVVDRSVAIAAIATQQMIRKDFATEMDENRMRTSAISMVKATAGSLAQVTSKEPLRANFTNYMRTLSNELPQGLPEGTIIMCVNSNLDLASSIIEKSTEERAVADIEEYLEPELEQRRRHRLQRPNEPYIDPALSRWAMTIPPPYRLGPSLTGLTPEQMAIYDDFARPPRSTATPSTVSHVPSTSDATRSMANEVLQDQYSSLPSVPTPAETPSLPNLGPQIQAYPHIHSTSMVNGRQPEARGSYERVQKLAMELQRAAAEATEEHFTQLPRLHPVLEVIDALVQAVIKGHQTSEEVTMFAAEQMCRILFSGVKDTLALESAVHVLDTLRKIAGPALHGRVRQFFQDQAAESFLNPGLVRAVLETDLLDWQVIDRGFASALRQRKEGMIGLFHEIVELTILSDSPTALYSDFALSLEEAWVWIMDDPEVPGGKDLRTSVLDAMAHESRSGEEVAQKDKMEYIFEEWVYLCRKTDGSDKIVSSFIDQLHLRGVINTREDFFTFVRFAIDKSVERFEQQLAQGSTISDYYSGIDSLAKLIASFIKMTNEDEVSSKSSRADLLDSVFSLGVVLLNHHYVKRGDHFNQKVFFRFFSMLLHAVSNISDQLTDADRQEALLKIAARFNDLGPSSFPGFVFAWIPLIQHRAFLPGLLQLPDQLGWAPFTKILKQLLEFLGGVLKSLDLPAFAKDLYRATLKLLIVLQHDFPTFLVANHVTLCESIPLYCTQLINMVLMAPPVPGADYKMPDPMAPGLRVDRMPESQDLPISAEDPSDFLTRIGLRGILDQSLQSGPSEDIVAQITHAIQLRERRRTTYGYVPLSVDVPVINAIVTYIGNHAAMRARSRSPLYIQGSADIATLSMLLHELSPEGRYFLVSSMVNNMRYPNAHTLYFVQATLEIFGHDMSDPEETEIREQITRVFFERISSFWPHPWGLVVAVMELIKNDKYMFFELPFIKAAPEASLVLTSVNHDYLLTLNQVSERFATIGQRQ